MSPETNNIAMRVRKHTAEIQLLVKLNRAHNGVSDGSLAFLAFLGEMWKLPHIMSFPASYYSLEVLGFHKRLVIQTEIGFC